MAEGVSEQIGPSETENVSEHCAVCLEPFIHPARLPCGHVFCFLCIKGTANRSKRCAMCRQEIPTDFMERPTLVDKKLSCCSHEGNYQWYYEGRNGWWQYDERTSRDLEIAYKNGERNCELLVAGFLYIMDLDAMLQLRRNDPSKRRRIKRDLASVDKIGIAGLRCAKNYNLPTERSKRDVDLSNSHATSSQIDDASVLSESLDQTAENMTNVCESPL